jgi:hypothetical protein
MTDLAELKSKMPLKCLALDLRGNVLSVLFASEPSKYEMGAIEALAPLWRLNVWHVRGHPIDCETDEPNPFPRRKV